MEQRSKKNSFANYLADRWRAVGMSLLALTATAYIYNRTKDTVDSLVRNWDQTLFLGGTALLTGVGMGKVVDHILDNDKRPRRLLFRTGLVAATMGMVGTFPALKESEISSTTKNVSGEIAEGTNGVTTINGQSVIIFALPETSVSCQPIAPRQVAPNDSPWTIIRGALGVNEAAATGDGAIPEQATNQLHDKYPDLFKVELFNGQLVSVTCHKDQI